MCAKIRPMTWTRNREWSPCGGNGDIVSTTHVPRLLSEQSLVEVGVSAGQPSC